MKIINLSKANQKNYIFNDSLIIDFGGFVQNYYEHFEYFCDIKNYHQICKKLS